ncbi:hypothetical protein EJ04DRAFT_137637 [Polyplosphaeria fusca]|uniref:Uncharacterized protein n=1 Tax=Polyplosphaeria fusca TaxID=682080 RepID=A0A9P4UT46_9PLEO|nr:hypothetical protein EJ04DRAFT_137637 [Polyplosphaeria fusca]
MSFSPVPISPSCALATPTHATGYISSPRPAGSHRRPPSNPLPYRRPSPTNRHRAPFPTCRTFSNHFSWIQDL